MSESNFIQKLERCMKISIRNLKRANHSPFYFCGWIFTLMPAVGAADLLNTFHLDLVVFISIHLAWAWFTSYS